MKTYPMRQKSCNNYYTVRLLKIHHIRWERVGVVGSGRFFSKAAASTLEAHSGLIPSEASFLKFKRDKGMDDNC